MDGDKDNKTDVDKAAANVGKKPAAPVENKPEEKQPEALKDYKPEVEQEKSSDANNGDGNVPTKPRVENNRNTPVKDKHGRIIGWK